MDTDSVKKSDISSFEKLPFISCTDFNSQDVLVARRITPTTHADGIIKGADMSIAVDIYRFGTCSTAASVQAKGDVLKKQYKKAKRCGNR